MPRKKKEEVAVAKTPVKRPRKKAVEKKPVEEKKYKIPGHKTSFKKGGKIYKVGDIVLCSSPNEDPFKGRLTSVLASQIVVQSDDNLTRWFFYTGLKIQKVS